MSNEQANRGQTEDQEDVGDDIEILYQSEQKISRILQNQNIDISELESGKIQQLQNAIRGKISLKFKSSLIFEDF